MTRSSQAPSRPSDASLQTPETVDQGGSGHRKRRQKKVSAGDLHKAFSKRVARWSESRMAKATIVNVGLAQPEVGKTELPAT